MKDVKSKTTCYCGKTREKIEKTVEKTVCCIKCKRLLHAGCIKGLGDNILYGDAFYILVCSVCNSGSEYLARIELTWAELIHLVLYHLTILNRHKYFDLYEQILPFFHENWNKLNLFGDILASKKEGKLQAIVESLLRNAAMFKNGKEIKKSKTVYALREKVPPRPPPVYPTDARLHNDTVVWEFEVENRKYFVLTKKVPKNKCDPAKNGKRNIKTKVAVNGTGSVKKNNVNKCSGGLPYNENGNHKTQNKSKIASAPAFSEKSAQKGLLDSLIPLSPNHFNVCHPFLESTDKKTVSVNQAKVRKKRRWNGDMAYSETNQRNGHHTSSKVPSSNSIKNNDSFFNAKDFFSQNSEKNVKISFSVLAKRITSSGEIQYLFQENREKEPVAEMTQIIYFCDCPNCKTKS